MTPTKCPQRIREQVVTSRAVEADRQLGRAGGAGGPNKAYAAAAIGMPPDDFYAAIESDNAAVTEFGTRPGLALIAGGLPVIADNVVAGGIGVAGAMTGAEDRRIAEVATATTRG